MYISKITKVLFSPTDSTSTILTMITDNFGQPVTVLDITLPTGDYSTQEYVDDELVIFGVPVYGGRVPAIALERIETMQGNQTPAILVAAYGNRDFNDALLELKNTVEQHGFVVMAAAAFIAEHSIMHSVAQGRPDIEDHQKCTQFTKEIQKKLTGNEHVSDMIINLPGNFPYREYHGVPFKPQTNELCTKCGYCSAQCPVQAIVMKDTSTTNKDICITCMRCIKACPVHARTLDKQLLAAAEAAFAAQYSIRKEPMFFI